MQQEGLVERERRHALRERRGTAGGRLDVEHPRVPVEPGRGVLPQNPAQLGGALAVGLGRGGEVVPEQRDRLRPVRRVRQVGRDCVRRRLHQNGERGRGQGGQAQPGRPDHPPDNGGQEPRA